MILLNKLPLPFQVIDDGDRVPGWEGKIVGWVEDDSAQVLSHQEQNMA